MDDDWLAVADMLELSVELGVALWEPDIVCEVVIDWLRVCVTLGDRVIDGLAVAVSEELGDWDWLLVSTTLIVWDWLLVCDCDMLIIWLADMDWLGDIDGVWLADCEPDGLAESDWVLVPLSDDEEVSLWDWLEDALADGVLLDDCDCANEMM
jgi:hypothetical protein